MLISSSAWTVSDAPTSLRKAIRLLSSRLGPPPHKKAIRERTEYDASLEDSVKAFIMVLIQEEVNCQTYGATKTVDTIVPLPSGRITPIRFDTVTDTPSSSAPKPKPICTFPPHKAKSLRHFRTTVCADIDSATTLMGKRTLEKVQKSGVEATFVKLEPPRHFEMAAKNPDGSLTTITCTHAATIDTELHIRHGSYAG